MEARRMVSWGLAGTLAVFAQAAPAWASGGSAGDLGHQLPIWSILPFVGMLLSIAVCPLVNAHWWEKNMAKVSAFWALVFFLPFLVAYGSGTAFTHGVEVMLLDYVPFILLLFGLFVVSGGLILRGSLRGTPAVNTVLLLIGTLLASWIGTTGASMLLIRPVIRANEWRRYKAHTIIFFIFLVSNIGGALTPVGDPPLFLGFLRGVPFFWTMRLIAPMGLNVLVLAVLYYLLDSHWYRKEAAPPDDGVKEKLRVEGLHNLVYLAMVVGSVILSGMLAKNPLFADTATGELRGLTVMRHGEEAVVLPYVDLIREPIILLAALLSLRTTRPEIRRDNRFTWGPIKEVATLFAG
ncbi:MAG: sodium:proton antiporter, partial [Moorellales bacterium]